MKRLSFLWLLLLLPLLFSCQRPAYRNDVGTEELCRIAQAQWEGFMIDTSSIATETLPTDIHVTEHAVLYRGETNSLDEIGIAVDFKALKRELDAILMELDHKDLNTIPPFDKINPTSENIAKTIFDRLASKLNDNRIKVHKVRISENKSSGASYFED